MTDRKIIDYLVVRGYTRDELVHLVNENIKDWGWQPFGSLVVAVSSDDICFDFSQAMVKYEP